jgi:hypothetical protein
MESIKATGPESSYGFNRTTSFYISDSGSITFTAWSTESKEEFQTCMAWNGWIVRDWRFGVFF